MKPKINPPIKFGIKKIVLSKFAPLNLLVTNSAKPNPMTLIKTIVTAENLTVNHIADQNS